MKQDSDFSKNRAEEYGDDLWGYFIIPPYYKQLQLFRSNKPMIIEGGRGSGKTMLLRYLCHKTQFSGRRKCIPVDAFKRIGVYWKIDTQFTKLMSKRRKDDEEWIPIFINWGVLKISEGILSSLTTIAASNSETINHNTLDKIDFSPLHDYSTDIPVNYNELCSYVKTLNRKFQVYISNLKGDFLVLPFEFISTMISCIQKGVQELNKSVFDIYIDEYENLLDFQSRIINTWIKHSEIPLIFNVAMKKNALKLTETLGPERIVDVNDYRKISLDTLVEEHFGTFAPEIFLLKLKRYGYNDIPIDEEKLFSTNDLDFEYRKKDDYVKGLKAKIRTIFPSMSTKEVSASMLNQPAFCNRIKKDLEPFLNKKEINRILLYSNSFPDAIIILPAILNRKNTETSIILDSFYAYIKQNDEKYKNWIDNNVFGCILYYYGALNKICPLYSGFDAFTTMSKDNLRHFLELCLRSITLADGQTQIISPQDQALAVRSVSENMFVEIKSLGNRGNELYTFAMRLGAYFEEARKKITQSEPEQNHFNIKDTLSIKTTDLLEELVKWSVLYEYKLTKQKNLESGREYLLNPIYSSYFNISYRKKRRINLSNSEFEIIAFGEVEAFMRLLRNKLSDRVTDEQPSLFKI